MSDTTISSASASTAAGVSTMADNSTSNGNSHSHNYRHHLQGSTTAAKNNKNSEHFYGRNNTFINESFADGDDEEDENGGGEGDAEVWNAFTKSFHQVQSVLDRNRVLIQQVNENHQSKIHDNLVKNVGLIQEINGNISKVVSLYSDLSVNFSSMVHQRNDSKENSGKGEGNNLQA